MANFEYLITRPGILKIVTIAFGIISFVLISHAYSQSNYTEFYSNMTDVDPQTAKTLPGTELELYTYFITGLVLGISISYLIVYAAVYELCESSLNRRFDTGFHMFSALFLFAGGCTLFYAAAEINSYGCDFLDSRNITITRNVVVFSNEEKCHYFGEKIVGGIFSLINAAIYCFTGVTIFITKDL